MSNFIDLEMKIRNKDFLDLQITEKGDLQKDESFDTSINCALMTDGRADKSEVNKIELQRGTIVDLFSDGKNGSKLWLLEQSRNNITAKNSAIDYAKNALQFLVEKGYCKNVLVSGKLTSKGIQLFIKIQRFKGQFDEYKYNAWEKSIYKV